MPSILRAAALSALATAILPGALLAGECPADKQGTDLREPVALEAQGVTDEVLSSIDLAGEAIALPDRLMRIRKLTIEPGGIVPWHSHGDRPALILIVQGEINEYASTCAGPIHHVAGDVARETHETSHWWKNLGTETVVLYSFDILHDTSDHNM